MMSWHHRRDQGSRWCYYQKEDMSLHLWDEARHVHDGEVGFTRRIDTGARSPSLEPGRRQPSTTQLTAMERTRPLLYRFRPYAQDRQSVYDWEVGRRQRTRWRACVHDYELGREVACLSHRPPVVPEGVRNPKEATRYGRPRVGRSIRAITVLLTEKGPPSTPQLVAATSIIPRVIPGASSRP